MQYLLYCLVCFKVQGIIKEVFVVNVVGVTLAKHGVFMNRHTQDVKVASTQKGHWDPIPFQYAIDNR